MSADYPFPGYHEQQNVLPSAKEKFPRLAAVPSQVLQTNIRRLHDAWDFFQKRGYGFPRFKKFGQMKSILFPQFRTNPLTGWQIKLPKLGRVQINLHRPIPDGFMIKQVRVIKKASMWFAVISIQSDLEIPNPVPHGHFIGLDVGLLSYCATSDGFVEARTKFFQTEHRRLKVLQRRLSKKKKRSANYEKARLKVEKQHNHIAFKRKDYQFKLAHKLCDMADSIFVEDIDFRIMAKGFFGKHTIDAAFGQFRSILKYVGWRRGKFVAEVDHKGTSQTCPNCRVSAKKELIDRIHSCTECGYTVDRDIASAQELCNRGIETYRGTSEKQEIGSQEAVGASRTRPLISRVVLSGAMCLDKWRRGASSSSDVRSPSPF
jgi:putative transposase